MQGLLEQSGASTESVAGREDFGDPALSKAIDFVGQRLYSEEVGEQIASTFDNSPTANPDAIAVIAYKLTQKADEVTGGEIAEENLSVLGMLTLNEVLTVAEAAGMPIKPETAVTAMKRMVIMFASDNGIPAEQLQEAFAQVDDAQVGQAAAEAPDDLGDQIPDEDSPVGDNIESGLGDEQQEQRA